MKPDQEELRSDMEEPDSEPCDVFVDLGMLVVEGRTAGLTARGYGEGPHCPKLANSQVKHCCNLEDNLCVRNEQFRRHMLLLWRNNIPMSIEVLLSTEATQGNPKSLKADVSNYKLLEQWTIHMLPKRVPDVLITGKSLLHAVRSYLHFSQLSAWYSLSTGKIPANIVYRVCVPGEAFTNKFLEPPDTHSFPVANVGRSNAFKVTVKAMPRCAEGIPHFVRTKVDSPEADKMNMACALDPDPQKRSPSPPECARREKSPDTLLGDSLLDPPQSLRMYPKRFQSPSRCGSPVMEAPDHVLCRATARDERSRSRRVFDKNRTACLGGDVVDEIWEGGEKKEKKVVDNRCLGFALTPKETEEVLNLLHRRNSGGVRNSDVFGAKEKRSFESHYAIIDGKMSQVELGKSEEEMMKTQKNVKCGVGGGDGQVVAHAKEKSKFRMDSTSALVFHCKTGLPTTSSPAPMRKGTCFDFDSSLLSPNAIKNALYEKESKEATVDDKNEKNNNWVATNTSLLGSFEESVLNGRLEPVSTVEGFTADIAASGSFLAEHFTVPVTVVFYTISDTDKVSTPYLGHIKLGPNGYNVPKKGTIQVTFFNPHRTVVKMFIVNYDLTEMPINCQTFLRQRTFYVPVGANVDHPEASKWLRYLIHLRLATSKSGRLFLHTDVRIVVFRKSAEMDATTISANYELRELTRGPTNPKFSPLR